MDIAVLADEDTVLGFMLAGIMGIRFDEGAVQQQIEQLKDVKVLIVTERVVSSLRQHGVMEHIKATIAEIPDKGGSTGHALQELSRIFESAIGVQLKTEDQEGE